MQVVRRNKNTNFWLTGHRAQMANVNALAVLPCYRSWLGEGTCEIDGSLEVCRYGAIYSSDHSDGDLFRCGVRRGMRGHHAAKRVAPSGRSADRSGRIPRHALLGRRSLARYRFLAAGSPRAGLGVARPVDKNTESARRIG